MSDIVTTPSARQPSTRGLGSPRSNTIYDNRFLFTGREYATTYRSTTNSAFNFYEYRARAYNPKLGRFMSEDPKLFDAGDYNLFRYCHNDPIDFTDPMGTDSDLWTRTIERMQAYINSKNGGDAQWAMAKWADGSNNFQGTFAQFTAGQGLTMGQIQQKATSNRPDPSRYAPGQAYRAERSVIYSNSYEKNGKFVNLTDWSIKVFDKNGPLAGVNVSETRIDHLAQKDIGMSREEKYWSQKTNKFGFVPNPDHWQQSFTSRNGFDTIRQTLVSGGNTLKWDATQSPSGVKVGVSAPQTGYFLQPGATGY